MLLPVYTALLINSGLMRWHRDNLYLASGGAPADWGRCKAVHAILFH